MQRTEPPASSMVGTVAALGVAGEGVVWRWLAHRAVPATRMAAVNADRIQKVFFFILLLFQEMISRAPSIVRAVK